MLSPIASFYDGQDVFITGSSGFMGKVLVEKLLRSCPGIGTIYLLMRAKAGQAADLRLVKLLESKVFERVKKENPKVMSKVVVIEGDIAAPDLGISPSDMETLCESVSVVFHAAATVKFHETLRQAIVMNVLGTKKIIEMCKRMKKLKCFLYLSTAYSNCNRKDIEETVYPVRIPVDQLLSASVWMDDDLMESLTPLLTQGHPNTYTYTKLLTENYLLQEAENLPITIVRPSVVISSYQEPVPGWVDSMNGITKCVFLGSKGYLKSLHGNENLLVDLIPVDLSINLMVAAAWYRGTRKCDDIPIYLCTSGNRNPLTWKKLLEFFNESVQIVPSNNTFSFPKVSMYSSRLIYTWMSFWYHIFPCYVFDVINHLQGKNAKMVKTQRHIGRHMDRVEFYSNAEWRFTTKNIDKILDTMSSEDKQIFNFDVRQLDWKKQILYYCQGIKTNLMNEDMTGLEEAKNQLRKKYFIEMLIKIFFFFVILRVFTLIFQM